MSQFAKSVESIINTRAKWFVAILVAVFLGSNCYYAQRTAYWFDELGTLFVARLPGFEKIWQALAVPADSAPPFFFLITRTSAQAFGWTPLALRLPEMLGYLTMMLCIFCIVRRYTTPVYALIAFLASYLTRVPAYTIEARPYGLLLGFSSLALLFWMRATSGRNRLLSLTIMCLSLSAALGCHYYAVLTFFGLASGEAARSWNRKRIDWPVIAAFALATTTAFFFLPLIRATGTTKQGGFSPPTLQSFAGAMADLIFPLNGILFISLTVLLILLLRFANDGKGRQEAAIPVPAAHELVAWMALALAPVEALLLGKLVTGIIIARYFIVFVIGSSILLSVWMYRAFRHAAFASLTILCLFLFWFTVRNTIGSRRDNLSGELSRLVQANNPAHLPVAVVDGIRFCQLQYYASEDVRPNLVYLSDPSAAMQYSGSSLVDMNLKGWSGITPINVAEYSAFVHSHKSFLMLWGENGWLPRKLNVDGARMVFKEKSGVGALYSVDF